MFRRTQNKLYNLFEMIATLYAIFVIQGSYYGCTCISILAFKYGNKSDRIRDQSRKNFSLQIRKKKGNLMKRAYTSLIIIFFLLSTGLMLNGCNSNKLTDEQINAIAKKVSEEVYPKLKADLHKEIALLKESEMIKDSQILSVKKDQKSNKTDKSPDNQVANSNTNTTTDNPSFIPGPVNPKTATGLNKNSNNVVVTLNNHALMTKTHFDEVYSHITKLYPVSALKTASRTQVLEHIKKVEIMAAQATLDGANKDKAFLTSLQRPLTNVVISLLIGDEDNKKTQITDEVLKKHYDATKAIYRTRPYISANIIELPSLEFTPREEIKITKGVKNKIVKASELIEMLRKNPETFNETAKKVSINPSYKLGGKMDRIYPGDLSKDVHEKLMEAPINEILDPIKVVNGHYAVFQVTARHKEATKPFELVKGSIRDTLVKKQRLKSIQAIETQATDKIEAKLFLDRLDKEGKPEEILAQIQKTTITRDTLKKIIESQKTKGQNFSTLEQQKALLKGLYQQNLFSIFALKDPEYQKLHNIYLIFYQKEKLARYFLQKSISNASQITAEDITKEYEENPEKYSSKTPYIKTRHLIFTAKSDSDDDIKNAKERANSALDKLKAGTLMEDLVKTADSDSGNKKASPTHWFTAGTGTLGKEYFSSSSKADKDALIDNPIKIKNSFYVIKLEDKSEKKPLSLVKNTIVNTLDQKRQLAQYKELLDKAEKNNVVKIYPEALNK